MSEDRLIWRDGEFIPWESAVVHVLSQSLQRGTLVFDYMSVHTTNRGAAIFRLEEHLERLHESCRLVELPLTLTLADLKAACVATVKSNPGCTSIKISVLIPSVEVDIVPQELAVSVVIAAYDSRQDIISRNKGEFRSVREVSLMIEQDKRNRRHDIMPPQAKVAANYAATMVAKLRARRAGFDEILLLDEEGFVAEAPTANIFILDSDGALKTPPAAKVLHGVTRSTLIEVARLEGLEVVEADILPGELFDAAEVFLSATSVGVWPVTRIDGQVIGKGEMGPISAALLGRFRKIIKGEEPGFDRWLTFVDEA